MKEGTKRKKMKNYKKIDNEESKRLYEWKKERRGTTTKGKYNF